MNPAMTRLAIFAFLLLATPAMAADVTGIPRIAEGWRVR
jgi:hypothetical protein